MSFAANDSLEQRRGRAEAALAGFWPPEWDQQIAIRHDEVRLADVWHAISSNGWLVLASVLFTTLLATTYAIFAPPTYKAEVLISPVETDPRGGVLTAVAGQLGGLADLAGLPTLRAKSTDKALATLFSHKFIMRMIQEEGFKPLLFPDLWDGRAQSWSDSESRLAKQLRKLLNHGKAPMANPHLQPGEPSELEAYDHFTENILATSVEPETGLVKIAVTWSDPSEAANWANLIVSRLNADLRERAIQRAELSVAYLQEQAAGTTLSEVRGVLFRLIEEHLKTITLARITDEFAFEVIDPALPPERMAWPKTLLVVAVGAILGIAIGIALALIKGLKPPARADGAAGEDRAGPD